MTKKYAFYTIVIVTFFLVACGHTPINKATVYRDAEAYTKDGLQAFSEMKLSRAQWLFNHALLLYQGIDDQQGILHSNINLAEVALSAHDTLETKKHLDIAAIIIKNAAFQHYQPRITLLYAQNALQQKQVTQAESFLLPLLPDFIGTDPSATPDSIQLAAVANRTKLAFLIQKDEALWTQRFKNALLLSPIKNKTLEIRLLRFQSMLLQHQAQYEKAETNLLFALSEYKKSLSHQAIAATLLELGVLYMEQRRWQEAKDYLNRSIAVFNYLTDYKKVVHVTKRLEKVNSELDNLKRDKRLSL